MLESNKKGDAIRHCYKREKIVLAASLMANIQTIKHTIFGEMLCVHALVDTDISFYVNSNVILFPKTFTFFKIWDLMFKKIITLIRIRQPFRFIEIYNLFMPNKCIKLICTFHRHGNGYFKDTSTKIVNSVSILKYYYSDQWMLLLNEKVKKKKLSSVLTNVLFINNKFNIFSMNGKLWKYVCFF